MNELVEGVANDYVEQNSQREDDPQLEETYGEDELKESIGVTPQRPE